MSLPILVLDFDGVLSDYSSGWLGADVIPDPPVPGAIGFLREAVMHFRVAIFSSRSNQPGGVEAMQLWLLKHGWRPEHDGDLEFPREKPPALVTLDDRALTFDGTWPSMQTLKSFKPWNRK